MNYFEKHGAIEFRNKKMHIDGFYSAELYHNGFMAKRRASFFPAAWSREMVVDAIFEAYDDFIKKGAVNFEKNDSIYTVHGKLLNGIDIEMIISEAGKITTAYPIF